MVHPVKRSTRDARAARALLALSMALTFGCEEAAPIGQAVVFDGGCLRNEAPSDYDVYFVLDVSGSMTPYLEAMKAEMVGFAESFASEDSRGQPVTIDYHVVGFVNDTRFFPDTPNERMTSPVAVEAAIQDAIDAGRGGKNLKVGTNNAEVEENLLDALDLVIAQTPDAEANLVLIATDAPFRETPFVLAGANEVQADYESVLRGLESFDARVHAFTPQGVDGLTRQYLDFEALTSLDGSSVQTLTDSETAEEEIQESLRFIAREAACQ